MRFAECAVCFPGGIPVVRGPVLVSLALSARVGSEPLGSTGSPFRAHSSLLRCEPAEPGRLGLTSGDAAGPWPPATARKWRALWPGSPPHPPVR